MVNQTLAVKKEESTLMLTSDGEIKSEDFIQQIALRLAKTYKKPKKIKEEDIFNPSDFMVVTELALARGYNPLGEGFHYWKQGGQIQITDHYATLVNWAQKIEPFVFDLEVVKNGEDWIATACIKKRRDQEEYRAMFDMVLKTLLQADKNVEEALRMAKKEAIGACSTERSGRVEHDEVYWKGTENLIFGATPKGWVPGVTRAETRAMRNAIKASYGIPSSGEIRSMVLGSFGASPAQMQIMAETPVDLMSESPEIREHHYQLEAQAEKIKEESTSISLEERQAKAQEKMGLMRGDNSIAKDFIDAEVVEESAVDTLGWLKKFVSYGVIDLPQLDKIAIWLFGLKFEYLEDHQCQSTLAFVQRSSLLNQDKTIDDNKPNPVETRLNSIPELVGLYNDDKGKDDLFGIDEGKQTLQRLISKLSQEGKAMALLGEMNE